MTPKAHLRSKEASSPIDDFTNNHFQEVIADQHAVAKDVTRLVLCTGKIYHELNARRTKEELSNIAIVRIEQLYPWPEEQIKAALAPYTKVKEVVWCQEEPDNAGPWFFTEPRLRKLLGRDLEYAGRAESAVTAPGSQSLHKIEQEQLIKQALNLPA